MDTGEQEDEQEEAESRESSFAPEGLSALDAIIFPVFAGIMLTGMYLLIKWLDDPELLNKILKWSFSFANMVCLAKMLEDGFYLLYSFTFPIYYTRDRKFWILRRERRQYEAQTMSARLVQSSPIPGWTLTPPLSPTSIDYLWRVRDLPHQKFRLRISARGQTLLYAVQPLSVIFSTMLAMLVMLFTSFAAGPPDWRINNLLAHAFVYSYMSILSPKSFSTGSLLLAGLFLYDIYMVFFTPMMVTVATTLEIPAKILIPRPGTKHMAMLGLGDILLPGLVIAWALRFDLYLWYRNQASRDGERKAKYICATGKWGERFWTSTLLSSVSNKTREAHPSQIKGPLFAKPYFNASLVGYVFGLTLAGIMVQVYRHAQPALLYLVPGVLGAVIITAFRRGELRELWDYEEGKDEEGKLAQEEEEGGSEPNSNINEKSDEKDSSIAQIMSENKSWKDRLQDLWSTSIFSAKRMDKLEARQNDSQNSPKISETMSSRGKKILPFIEFGLLPSSSSKQKTQSRSDSNEAQTAEENLKMQRKENEGIYERELKELKKMK